MADEEIEYAIQKGRQILVMGRRRTLCMMQLYSDSDRLLGFTSKTFTVIKGKYTPYIYTYSPTGKQLGTPVQAPRHMRKSFI